VPQCPIAGDANARDSISLISYAGCLCLSSVISAKFTLEMCVAAEIAKKKSPKALIFGGGG